MVVSKTAKAVVTDPAVFVKNAKFAVEAVKSEISELTGESIVIAFPLPPPSGSDSSFDEDKKKRKNKSLRSKHCRRSAISVPTGKGTRSKRSLSGSNILVKNNAVESHAGNIASKLRVLHATNTHLPSDVKYNN